MARRHFGIGFRACEAAGSGGKKQLGEVQLYWLLRYCTVVSNSFYLLYMYSESISNLNRGQESMVGLYERALVNRGGGWQ